MRDLKLIQDDADAATPGPWVCVKDTCGLWSIRLSSKGVPVAIESLKVNSEFVANARTDVPDLVAEVRRLRGELAAWEQQWRDIVVAYCAWEHGEPDVTLMAAFEKVRRSLDAMPATATPQPAPDCSASAMMREE
jgi:hypothetical protein